jgi:hypothetical protein
MQQSNRCSGSAIQREASYFSRVQRLAVHHGARVVLRVVIGRQRDGTQRLLPDAVLMHVALHRMAKRCGGEITP